MGHIDSYSTMAYLRAVFLTLFPPWSFSILLFTVDHMSYWFDPVVLCCAPTSQSHHPVYTILTFSILEYHGDKTTG